MSPETGRPFGDSTEPYTLYAVRDAVMSTASVRPSVMMRVTEAGVNLYSLSIGRSVYVCEAVRIQIHVSVYL